MQRLWKIVLSDKANETWMWFTLHKADSPPRDWNQDWTHRLSLAPASAGEGWPSSSVSCLLPSLPSPLPPPPSSPPPPSPLLARVPPLGQHCWHRRGLQTPPSSQCCCGSHWSKNIFSMSLSLSFCWQSMKVKVAALTFTLILLTKNSCRCLPMHNWSKEESRSSGNSSSLSFLSCLKNVFLQLQWLPIDHLSSCFDRNT